MAEQDFIKAGFTVVGTENNENKLLSFLKENYPNVIRDTEINLEELKTVLGLPIDEKVNGYGLNFVGRNFARAKYAQKTEKELRLNNTLSKNIDTTENLVLKGDNLNSLKILKNYYSGQINCIYIDPPYNTGNDSFKYNDTFNRSTWLTFMRNRLFAAKELLTKAGWADTDNDQILDKIIDGEKVKFEKGTPVTEAFKLLRSYSRTKASRYQLKRGLMEFGPTGFPFERFVGELFKHQGYNVQVDVTVQGKCVTHEIDVIATKPNEINYVECKYRNQQGYSVDVKNPLYIYARFQDVLDNGLLQSEKETFQGYIATNTKFTEDALAYGNCKNLKLISWNYPIGNSLKDIIDNSGIYPLTCLATLTKNEKQLLLKEGYILVKEIFEQPDLLKSIGIKETRIETIKKEGILLCQPLATTR
mgnify:CR=1 FL=1